MPSTSKSTKLSLSGVIRVSAIEWASRVEVAVGARRVDDDEIVRVLDRGDGVGEAGEFLRLVLVDLEAVAARDAEMRRQFESELRPLRPGAPVADVMGEAALARVEVDGGDALASLHQRDRDMHRGGRFARAALLVAEHDHMGGSGLLRPFAVRDPHGLSSVDL